MILYKRARTNERRRKILGGGGGGLRYASPEKFWNFSPQKCFFRYTEDLLLQIATAFLLQTATSVITKCDRWLQSGTILLQSATEHRRLEWLLLSLQVFHSLLMHPLQQRRVIDEIDWFQ